jgi:hypothetical protein
MNKTLTPMLVLVLASCVSSGTKEAEGDILETWCSTTGGTRATWSEENDNVVRTLLPAAYGKNCNESFERYLGVLKSLLKEGKISEQDKNSYTIRIETTVNYGQEYTESTEVKIGKNVYAAITGN